ncbi:MAG: hypothetical protein V2A79_19845 [Planctomycetota bacterium]
MKHLHPPRGRQGHHARYSAAAWYDSQGHAERRAPLDETNGSVEDAKPIIRSGAAETQKDRSEAEDGAEAKTAKPIITPGAEDSDKETTP